MKTQTRELVTIAGILVGIPLAALLLLKGDHEPWWEPLAMASLAAGMLFTALAVLSMFGIPKSPEDAAEEDEDDDDEERPRWKHIRLWQLCAGLGIPLAALCRRRHRRYRRLRPHVEQHRLLAGDCRARLSRGQDRLARSSSHSSAARMKSRN